MSVSVERFRTNYFNVRNIHEFKNEIQLFSFTCEVKVFDQVSPDGGKHFCVWGTDTVTHTEDPKGKPGNDDICLEIAEVIANHIIPGNVCVLHTVWLDNDGQCDIGAYSQTITSDGVMEEISICPFGNPDSWLSKRPGGFTGVSRVEG